MKTKEDVDFYWEQQWPKETVEIYPIEFGVGSGTTVRKLSEFEIRQEKWDKRFLALAEHISTWSKDPSTKCGCVIVRPDKTIASVGYNGFPRGIEDKQEWLFNREEKYKRVIHGEMNAILSAREPLKGYTLYTYPGPISCERCSVHIIQAGITRVVAANADPSYTERWKDNTKVSMELYKEAGVEVKIYENN